MRPSRLTLLNFHLLRIPHILLFSAVLLTVPGGISTEAQENGEKQKEENTESEQDEELKSLREKRQLTLQYGIESQILGLVKKLKKTENTHHNEALIEVFERTTNPTLQSNIADFFKSIESDALREKAFTKLKDYDELRPDPVSSLIDYLEEYQNEEITALFQEMMEDPRSNVASRAVQALGKSGNEGYTDKLIQLYEDSSSERMQESILESLGYIGSDEAVELLTQVVKNEGNSKSLRWKACTALGRIGNPDSLKTIEYLFSESDPYLRMYAVRALQHFEDDRVIDLLMEALKDNHWRVRVAAAKSLGETKAEKAVPILKFKAEHDPERNNVAPAAVRALGKIGRKESYSFLRKLYSSEDYSFSLRLTALQMLVQNDLRNSLATIRKVIDEEWNEENSKILEYTCKELSTTEDRILQPLYQKMLSHPKGFHIPIYGLRGIRLNNVRALKSEVKKLTGEGYHRAVRELAKSVHDEL